MRRRTSQEAPARDSLDLRDDAAVRAAYAAYGGELYRFALRQLGDPGSAEDVVQEVFVRAWRSADRFDPQVASLRVWLFAIARHVVVDESRRAGARRSVAMDDDTLVRVAGWESNFDEQVVTRWVLEEAMARLSHEHRTALLETHVRGRPYEEVAAQEGIPVGTLRSRVFYGLKALRLAMDEMGVEL